MSSRSKKAVAQPTTTTCPIHATNEPQFLKADTALVKALDEAIHKRMIKTAQLLLQPFLQAGVSLDPTAHNAGAIADYVARWIDFDPSILPTAERLVEQFRTITAEHLSQADGCHIDLAKGIIAMHLENQSKAISHFESVIKDATRWNLPSVLADAEYFLARALWKTARYKDAREHCLNAQNGYDKLNYPTSKALVQLMDARLAFLEGDVEEARNSVLQLQVSIRPEDDIRSYINVMILKARLERITGDPDDAAALDRAKTLLQECLSLAKEHGVDQTPTAARAHVHLAFVYRLQAFNRADQRMPKNPVVVGFQRRAAREQINAHVRHLRTRAHDHLDAAYKIYATAPKAGSRRGMGNIHTNRALLAFDDVNPDEATIQINCALNIGSAVTDVRAEDHVVLANANVVKCMLEYDDGRDKDAYHAAQEALRHANLTDNRRLKIRVNSWYARCLITETFRDPTGAARHWNEANELLCGENDYLSRAVKRTKQMLDDYRLGEREVVRLTSANVVNVKWEQIARTVQEEVVVFLWTFHSKSVGEIARGLGLGYGTVNDVVRRRRLR